MLVHGDYSRTANSGQKFLQYFENYLEFFAVLIIMDLLQDFCGMLVGGIKKHKHKRARTHTHIYIFLYIYIYAVLMFSIKLFCNTLYIIRTSVLPERINSNIPKTLL
jgi:hypothetical protein